MPIEESSPKTEPPTFELGQAVVDREGQYVGKVKARFSRYILVERGALFVKAYYVPHGVISKNVKGTLQLSVTQEEMRELGFNQVPDDLYIETPEPGVPDVSGVAQFARGPHPLSPAETGHYNYGRHWPGMNTDASGSYHREEVTPKPQEVVGEKIYVTDLPIPPREISPD